MVKKIPPQQRARWPRLWISYDDEQHAVSNPNLHKIGETPGGMLVVRRPKGYSWRRELDELRPEEFQMRLATHRSSGGNWDPLRLYRAQWDAYYIRVGRDPTPEQRREWLMREHGLVV